MYMFFYQYLLSDELNTLLSKASTAFHTASIPCKDSSHTLCAYRDLSVSLFNNNNNNKIFVILGDLLIFKY